MGLFTLKCETCGNIWTDIYKTYVCPNCHSKDIHIVDDREGIFTEGGQSYVGAMIAMALVGFLAFSVVSFTVRVAKSMVAKNNQIERKIDLIKE